jgi:hypothetical protein
MTNISHEMLIMREETFCTEISAMTFDTDQEAIRLANDSEYGLNASIWTNEISKARKFAKLINASGVKEIDLIRIPEIWWYTYSLKKMNLFRRLIRAV